MASADIGPDHDLVSAHIRYAESGIEGNKNKNLPVLLDYLFLYPDKTLSI
jgi:hypothetical protein